MSHTGGANPGHSWLVEDAVKFSFNWGLLILLMDYNFFFGFRVFDITNRKNFCSDWCFTASKYILEQIPETPIWTRDGKQKKTVSVYPKDRPGRPGDEIILNELAEELEQINLIDDKESAELTDKLKKPDCHVVDSRSRLREMSQRKVDFLPEAIVVNEDDEVDQESYSQDEGRGVKMLNLYSSLCNQLFAWRTRKTIQFLTGEVRIWNQNDSCENCQALNRQNRILCHLSITNDFFVINISAIFLISTENKSQAIRNLADLQKLRYR